jgi:hypothetical protein
MANMSAVSEILKKAGRQDETHHKVTYLIRTALIGFMILAGSTGVPRGLDIVIGLLGILVISYACLGSLRWIDPIGATLIRQEIKLVESILADSDNPHNNRILDCLQSIHRWCWMYGLILDPQIKARVDNLSDQCNID